MSASVGDADPFGTTTDADAYVPRPACERALGELVRELREGRKLLALTGPTGIGKTQLLRVLAQRLDGEADVLILPYAGLGFDDLCRWALGLLGEPLARGADIEPSQALLETARRRSAEGRMLVLALDDASGLPPASARLLTRLVSEAAGALRLVVVPVDDPRAGRVLAALGRGVCEVRLNVPMTEDETAAYIDARLARQPPPAEIARRFDEGAIGWLHRASGGFPRELHHLAFRIQRGLADPAGDPFARREQWLEVEGEDAVDEEPQGAAPTPVGVLDEPAAVPVAAPQEPVGAPGSVPPAPTGDTDEASIATVVPPAAEPDEPVEPAPAPPLHAPPAPRPAPAAVAPAASPVISPPAGAGREPRLPWILGPAAFASVLLLVAFWLIWRSPTMPPVDPSPAAPAVADLEAPTSPATGPETSPVPEFAEPAPAVTEPVIPEEDPLELIAAAQTPAAESSPAEEPPAPAPLAEDEPEPAPGPPAALDDAAQASAVRVPVNLNARPWATVWIDGVERGTTPLAGVPLEEGIHHFRLVFPDGHVREAERQVDAENRHFSFGL